MRGTLAKRIRMLTVIGEFSDIPLRMSKPGPKVPKYRYPWILQDGFTRMYRNAKREVKRAGGLRAFMVKKGGVGNGVNN